MLQEARLHQVSRARMVALYGGALLALVGFLADNVLGLTPFGLLFVTAGMVLALAACLKAGRSLASRIVAAVLSAIILTGAVLALVSILVFALSDFTLVVQGEGSPVQVSDGIGSLSTLAVVGLAALVFSAGLIVGRLVRPVRLAFSRLFDAVDEFTWRRSRPKALVSFSVPSHQDEPGR